MEKLQFISDRPNRTVDRRVKRCVHSGFPRISCKIRWKPGPHSYQDIDFAGVGRIPTRPASNRSACWPELATADFGANLFAISQVGFRRNPQLRGRFPDPLALTSLNVDAAAGRVDREGRKEAVTVRTSVLDPTELGVNLRRVALITVGATDPFIGGRVDVQVGNLAHAGYVVNVGVPVDCQ